MSRRILLLDAGHNASFHGHPLTRGKRSPEIPPGFYEGDWNREVCDLVVKMSGNDPNIVFLNPGPIGKSLWARRLDVNRLYNLEPGCVLLSVHANASGNTLEWRKSTGTTAFIKNSPWKRSRINLESENFANELLSIMCNSTGLRNRGVKRANLAMTRVECPSVLLETLFMDNLADIKTPPESVAGAILEAWREFCNE